MLNIAFIENKDKSIYYVDYLEDFTYKIEPYYE